MCLSSKRGTKPEPFANSWPPLRRRFRRTRKFKRGNGSRETDLAALALSGAPSSSSPRHQVWPSALSNRILLRRVSDLLNPMSNAMLFLVEKEVNHNSTRNQETHVGLSSLDRSSNHAAKVFILQSGQFRHRFPTESV